MMMMMMRLTLIAALLISQISCEQYSFDFTGREAVVTASSAGYHGPGAFPARKLQQNEDCLYVGSKLRCTYTFEVEGANKTKTSVRFQAECEANSQTKFDFRRAAGCSCQALVSVPNEPTKLCPCTVCQAGFGENPINVDCSGLEAESDSGAETATKQATKPSEQFGVAIITDDDIDPTIGGGAALETGGGATITNGGGSAVVDTSAAGGGDSVLNTTSDGNVTVPESTPFIVNTCTSVDCSGACNGTCSLNCADSDTSCIYCGNAAANQPTASPTGAGNDDIIGYTDRSKSGSEEYGVVFYLAAFSALVILVL